MFAPAARHRREPEAPGNRAVRVQVCIAESERKVAEMAWRDAASALFHAKAARKQAEQNWHEVRPHPDSIAACCELVACR